MKIILRYAVAPVIGLFVLFVFGFEYLMNVDFIEGIFRNRLSIAEIYDCYHGLMTKGEPYANSNNPKDIFFFANCGVPEAQYDYARSIDLDFPFTSKREAAFFYEKSARGGNVNAMFRIGVVYRYGLVFGTDYLKAIYWFEKASAQNHAASALMLGSMLENGLGVQDHSRARELYTTAAKMGQSYAAYRLGYLYQNGQYVEKNSELANYWFGIESLNIEAFRKETKIPVFRYWDKNFLMIDPIYTAIYD